LSSNENPKAIELLEKYREKIVLSYVCLNPNGIKIIKENIEKLDDTCYQMLLFNINGIDILERKLEKESTIPTTFNWSNLSLNPNAIELLEKYPEKINLYNLCTNPNGINILERNKEIINKDKIAYKYLSKNPNIFIYDYDRMRTNMKEISEKLLEKYLSPKNILCFTKFYDKEYQKYM